MTIKFYTQSDRETARIWVRVRHSGGIDAKAGTPHFINPKYLKNGRTTIKPGIASKLEVSLRKLQRELNNLNDKIRDEIDATENLKEINSKWLKNIVDPPEIERTKIDTVYLTGYIDYYIKDKLHSGKIKPGTVKKIESIKNQLSKFEADTHQVKLRSMDNPLRLDLIEWLEGKGYGSNSRTRTLKTCQAVATHAKRNGIPVHENALTWGKGEKYTRAIPIYLTTEDLKKIEAVELKGREAIARDWLIISCHTGQRASDLFRFTKDKLVTVQGETYIEITQKKTGEPIEIPTVAIEHITTRYDGGFPLRFSDNDASNEAIYNRLLKSVCKKAGLTREVEKIIRRTKDTPAGRETVPMYEAISSHIGRKTFATNYYNRFPTSYLTAITGHKTEKQFLDYIGKNKKAYSRAFAKELREQMKEGNGFKIYKQSS